ncbi:hypothetical protein GCM10009547_33710 [Sporichthya brevicatena]|uniref:Uncharacterized protein n=1 Tax=Sporichthya brevicatena TaxID=171442 RepID=A0ABN1H2S6_9ACTN
MSAVEIERKLDEVVAALRALAMTTTLAADDPEALEARAEAVRLAGAAFDEAVAEVTTEYGTVFAIPETEDGEWDLEDVDDGSTRLSVDVRADFVVSDEQTFLTAARRLLTERGGRVLDARTPLSALDALVDAVGLDALTTTPPPGLDCVGGEWGVSAELDES